MSKTIHKGGILRVFLNVDMRNGHDGLTALAKDNGISTDKIEVGSYVVFVNHGRNKIKLFAAGGVVAYLRLTSGRQFNMAAIKEIPRVFDGKSINYDKALNTALDEALKKKTTTVYSI